MHSGDGHEQLAGEPIVPAAVKGILAMMEQSMLDDPSQNRMGVPAKTAVDLIRSGQASSFSQVEDWLRSTGSNVYFIAVPLDYYEPGWVGKIKYPFEAEGEPEYTLWVELRGAAWAEDKLSFLKISPQENRERLLTTGLPSKVT